MCTKYYKLGIKVESIEFLWKSTENKFSLNMYTFPTIWHGFHLYIYRFISVSLFCLVSFLYKNEDESKRTTGKNREISFLVLLLFLFVLILPAFMFKPNCKTEDDFVRKKCYNMIKNKVSRLACFCRYSYFFFYFTSSSYYKREQSAKWSRRKEESHVCGAQIFGLCTDQVYLQLNFRINLMLIQGWFKTRIMRLSLCRHGTMYTDKVREYEWGVTCVFYTASYSGYINSLELNYGLNPRYKVKCMFASVG